MEIVIALIFGLVAGVVASPTLAYIVDGITNEGELHWSATAQLFALLGGTTIIGLPVSSMLDRPDSLGWFVIGWATLVIPVGLLVWARFALGRLRSRGRVV